MIRVAEIFRLSAWLSPLEHQEVNDSCPTPPLAPNHNHARKTPAQQDRPWAPLPNCNENSGAFGQRACKRWLTAGAPPAGIGNLGDLPTVLVVETWVQPQISTPPLGALLPGPGSGPGPGLLRTQTQVTLQPTPSERAREAVREACDKGDITVGDGFPFLLFVHRTPPLSLSLPTVHIPSFPTALLA
ncbi:hypothetical protein MCOR02_005427 [Pyricularia oryzae]|nr:hypothetical protein MCOR02_005427 [Pyricularia oryzae]